MASTTVERKNLFDEVITLIKKYEELGLKIPEGYDLQGELARALLKIKQMKVKEYSVLEFCTRASIVQALFDMVLQGLNVNQGYFIPYGKKLVFQRSYFGTVALLKRLTGATEVVAQLVYQGDEFEFTIEEGIYRITKHRGSLQDMVREKVIAAYAVIKFPNGKQYTEIMPLTQILTAWRMSKTKPFGEDGKLRRDSIHYIFFEEMAKRTVIQRACKLLLNSAVDPTAQLIVQRMREEYEEADEKVLEKETSEAIENIEVLEIPAETETVPDPEPNPEPETEPEPEVEKATNPEPETEAPF